MSYDHGLAARMADTLAALGQRGIRQKNVFGGRGFLVGKSTFAIAWEDGLSGPLTWFGVPRAGGAPHTRCSQRPRSRAARRGRVVGRIADSG